jgi:mycofactocin glycosyltransferase
VLFGGVPARLIRLTAGGASLVDRWAGGEPVGPDPAAAALAGRLVDSGLAHPRPPPGRRAAAPCVVIPVLDDATGLIQTLDTLDRQGFEADVVVVDDGSDPPLDEQDVAPHYRRGQVRVHRRATPGGPAVARNAGRSLASSTAEAVLFLDAGCEPEPGSLQALLDMLADPAVGAAAPRVVARAEPGTPEALAAYEMCHSPLDLGEDEAGVALGARVAYVPSAALLVRRVTLDGAGWFDEDLRFGEDVDLVWRLAAAGWRVRYLPGSRVSHPARRGWTAWLGQRFSYGRSAADLAERHGCLVAPVVVTPAGAAVWAIGLGWSPVAALAVGAINAARFTGRAGSFGVERGLARKLWWAALAAQASLGPAAARAVRRAWLPPAVAIAVAVAAMGGRRGRALVGAAAAACLVLAGDGRRVGSPGAAGRLGGLALGLADDLAYQAGVWCGVVEHRSLRAVAPRISGRSAGYQIPKARSRVVR